MTDMARIKRNNAKLEELHPAIRPKVAAILSDLEGFGYRPRIQCAFRSVADQRKAVSSGNSRVTWGFHCAMGSGGNPQALAADILDDDAPTTPNARYLVNLRRSARAHGMDAPISWDRTHVEVVGISLAEAKRGVRPSMPK